MLSNGFSQQEIIDGLKVGKSTVQLVARLLSSYPRCFELIQNRSEKVKRQSGFKNVGGSKLVFKKRVFVKKSDIGR
jgi:hypothetical protein